jgi:hypothetical protein
MSADTTTELEEFLRRLEQEAALVKAAEAHAAKLRADFDARHAALRAAIGER